MFSRLAIIATVLTLCAVSHAAQLVAVEAGSVTGAAPVDIEVLKSTKAATVQLCPEDYPNGFSVECRGSDVNPQGGVQFDVNDNRVQTEWISPPYMIAGDLDRGPGGLTFIEPWEDWMEVNNRCANRNKDCVLRIRCTHRDGTLEKRIVIKKASECPTTPPPPADCPTDNTCLPDGCVVPDSFCPCDAGNLKNCGDFASKELAQACFDKCNVAGAGDIHGLDGNNDGTACASLTPCS